MAHNWGPLAFPKVHCSEGPLFRRSDVPKVRCSEGPLFRRFIAPKVRYSETKVHCSENKVQYSEKEWIYMDFFFFCGFQSEKFFNVFRSA